MNKWVNRVLAAVGIGVGAMKKRVRWAITVVTGDLDAAILMRLSGGITLLGIGLMEVIGGVTYTVANYGRLSTFAFFVVGEVNPAVGGLGIAFGTVLLIQAVPLIKRRLDA